MLNQDDRRQLAEIERHLRAEDPDFAARMSLMRPRGRWRLMVPVCVLMWAVVPMLGFLAGWSIALAVAPTIAVATVTVVCVLRRRPDLSGPL